MYAYTHGMGILKADLFGVPLLFTQHLYNYTTYNTVVCVCAGGGAILYTASQSAVCRLITNYCICLLLTHLLTAKYSYVFAASSWWWLARVRVMV